MDIYCPYKLILYLTFIKTIYLIFRLYEIKLSDLTKYIITIEYCRKTVIF